MASFLDVLDIVSFNALDTNSVARLCQVNKVIKNVISANMFYISSVECERDYGDLIRFTNFPLVCPIQFIKDIRTNSLFYQNMIKDVMKVFTYDQVSDPQQFLKITSFVKMTDVTSCYTIYNELMKKFYSKEYTFREKYKILKFIMCILYHHSHHYITHFEQLRAFVNNVPLLCPRMCTATLDKAQYLMESIEQHSDNPEADKKEVLMYIQTFRTLNNKFNEIVYEGPKGGKYIFKNGRKVYIRKP